VKRTIAIVIVDYCLCLQEKWGAELVIVRTDRRETGGGGDGV
jgi:hypothetical protein